MAILLCPLALRAGVAPALWNGTTPAAGDGAGLVDVPGVLIEATPDIAWPPIDAVLIAIGGQDGGIPAVLNGKGLAHAGGHLAFEVAVDVDVQVLRRVTVDHQLARLPGRLQVAVDGLLIVLGLLLCQV